MQVNSIGEKAMTRHQGILTCKKSHQRKLQHKVYRHSALSLDEKFTVYGRELERVKYFKYLGKLLMCDNNDIQDVCSNLTKACMFWRQISDVLQSKQSDDTGSTIIRKQVVEPHQGDDEKA